MPKRLELIGHVFGRLSVIAYAGPRSGKAFWECSCSCGGFKQVASNALCSGHTQSCGCWKEEANKARTTHGHARRTGHSRTHNSWTSMMTRCTNSSVDSFQDYGLRGIEVCERWHQFENFLADMGERPPRLTLERRDNEKGYEPGNCVWATRRAQSRNTRANSWVVYQGRHLIQADFAQLIGLSQSTVSARMRAGWTPDEIASIPIHAGRRMRKKEPS